MRFSGVLLTVAAAGLLLTGCDPAKSSAATAKASTCTQALGLADLDPLVDGEKLKQRAQDKAARLRSLAADAGDKDVKAALTGLADSYIQVQKEHLEDAAVVAKWVKNNLSRLDALRKACT